MKHLTGQHFLYILKALHFLCTDFPYEFYYTGWSLLTVTNVRYSELGEVPYLDSVVCWQRCIWKEFRRRLIHHTLTSSLPHVYRKRPESYFRSLTEIFQTVLPFWTLKYDSKAM